VAVDALLAKVRELLQERMRSVCRSVSCRIVQEREERSRAIIFAKGDFELSRFALDPSSNADLVSCAVLAGGTERQRFWKRLT